MKGDDGGGAPESVSPAGYPTRAVSFVLVGVIRGYQVVLGPLFAGVCRFQPSCSRYAAEAIRRHGPLPGLLLGARRLLSCRPFGGSGYDPVPRDPGAAPFSDRGGARPVRRPEQAREAVSAAMASPERPPGWVDPGAHGGSA